MGKNPRKIQTDKEALREIGKLEDKFCKGCKKKEQLRKAGNDYYAIQNYCMNDCKIGRKIKALGGILEYGAYANNHFKAPDLNKETYIELREKGLSDGDIRERFNISRATLTRRKGSWGLNKVKAYTLAKPILLDLTKEKLEELTRLYTTKEICDMYGCSRMAIQKRRKKWGIENVDHTIANRFTKEEYLYLSRKKGLLDKEIADLWEIGTASLTKAKKKWGIGKFTEKSNDPAAQGLTYEKLLELVPNYTDQEIADMYGVYVTSLTKYRKKLGISAKLRKARYRIKPEYLKSLLDSGLSKTKAAKELGIHRRTVDDLIKYFSEKNLF